MLAKNMRPAWKVLNPLWKVFELTTSLRVRRGIPSRRPSMLLDVMRAGAGEREVEDETNIERKG